MPKLCPNIRFPHQQDFFPIRSFTKSSTSIFSHENLVEKFKIFVQDFVPIRTALSQALTLQMQQIVQQQVPIKYGEPTFEGDCAASWLTRSRRVYQATACGFVAELTTAEGEGLSV